MNTRGAEGAEVIYSLRNDDTFASKILNKLSEKGQTIRRVYQKRLPSDNSKDYYYMLRNTPNAESVIVEYGFIDNKKDAQKLKENYKDYAEAVIEAVLEYKNINIEEPGYYIVKKGDTLWSIANKNNTTVGELKRINNLNTNSLTVGQKLKLPNTIDDNDIPNIPTIPNTYIVQSGDTLYSIANKYGITVDELKEVNNLTSNVLSIGQILIIPQYSNSSNTYLVEKGDTLYSIANKFGTTVDAIKELNNLISNTLSLGQILLLPVNNDIDNDTEYDFYTIKRGDTLYSIANIYGISVSDLKRINNITSDNLTIGDLIKVPKIKDNIYTVRKGDTLWSIAKDNNITVDRLKELNNLISNSLTIGQQLLLS